MKKLSISLLVLGLATSAFAYPTWMDSNGLVWTMVAGRTAHARAEERCRLLGFELPEVDDLLEAFESGLADPLVNTEFGASAKETDWSWTSTPHTAPSPFFYIVSRWSDTAPVPHTERHFVMCVK